MPKCKECGLYPWLVGADLDYLPEAVCHPSIGPRRFTNESIELEHDCPPFVSTDAEPTGAEKLEAKREAVRSSKMVETQKPLKAMNKKELLARAADVSVDPLLYSEETTNKVLAELITERLESHQTVEETGAGNEPPDGKNAGGTPAGIGEANNLEPDSAVNGGEADDANGGHTDPTA